MFSNSYRNNANEALTQTLFPQQTMLRNIVLVVIGSLFIALTAQISIQIPIGPVPITGQTFGVLLIGALLGSRLGSLSAILYIVEGLQFPVYANATFGWSVLTGATGGYLLSFPIAAFLVGWLSERGWDRKPGTLLLAMIAGNIIIYLFGVPWLINSIEGTSFNQGLQWGLIPFIPGDLAKIFVATALVPAGWVGLNSAGIGTNRSLGIDSTSSILQIGREAKLATFVLLISGFIAFFSVSTNYGISIIISGIMTVSAFQLLHRSYISSALSQIIAFAGASFGGLVALVHLISFEDQLKIANTDVVVIVGIFTAIVILISLVPKFQDETITKEK
tara:strand:+ start:3614 stop:4615 length:1002 start_codon:yes stop_codon:yes gene_type:complete